MSDPIEEAETIRGQIFERLRKENPYGTDAELRWEAFLEFHASHVDEGHAEIIAEMERDGLSPEQIAYEVELIKAQGMW